MIRVTMTQNVAGNPSYTMGQEYDVDDVEAARMVAANIARTTDKGVKLPAVPPSPAQIESGGSVSGDNINAVRLEPLVNLPTSLPTHQPNDADGQRLPASVAGVQREVDPGVNTDTSVDANRAALGAAAGANAPVTQPAAVQAQTGTVLPKAANTNTRGRAAPNPAPKPAADAAPETGGTIPPAAPAAPSGQTGGN